MPSPFKQNFFMSGSPVERQPFSSTNRMNRQYFSKHRYKGASEQLVDEYQLFSPLAIIWVFMFLLAPISYFYIGMVVLRELFGEYLLVFGQNYVPLLHQWTLASAISNLRPPKMPHDLIIGDSFSAAADGFLDSTGSGSSFTIPNVLESTSTMERNPRTWLWLWIEVWCSFEALFFILMRIRIRWLRNVDPLEASLSAAPLMDLSEREYLWRRMQEVEDGNVSEFLSGWFFDHDCQDISAYDVRDFVCWSMFECRHQEHLSEAELLQMESFVEELEWRISLEMYGPDTDSNSCNDDRNDTTSEDESQQPIPQWRVGLPKPKKLFQFPGGNAHEEENNFFTNLFESYRRRYDQMDFRPVQDLKDMMQKAAGDNFHPVKDFRELVAGTAQSIAEAEAVASQKASQIYESFVPTGSMVDKKLNATYLQLHNAWNSVKALNDQRRLETARFLSNQRQRLKQQMIGYRLMLNRMLHMSSGVPSKQMASLMRRITECYEAMENLEGRAEAAFVDFTGFALKSIPTFMQRKEPQGYAKYSADPIENVATFPLCLHLLLIGCTEIPLRIMMHRRGFSRRKIGNVAYYFHPGSEATQGEDIAEVNKLPFVFVHGIGLGLVFYIPFIDDLLRSGRPIFLPEIPYVSGFRPWQSSSAVLPPAVVASTMSAMLATHGYLTATWIGHSYGTSWLSYMTKLSPEAVSALLFLDPICFCLHYPRLTKSFVYTRPDIGTISYILRTDAIVRHTIQRQFPWPRIILFADQIHVPCHIILSYKDQLVPSVKVSEYLKKKDVPIHDFESIREQVLASKDNGDTAGMPFYDSTPSDSNRIQCIIMYEDGHGRWVETPHHSTFTIAHSAEALCRRAEQEAKSKTS